MEDIQVMSFKEIVESGEHSFVIKTFSKDEYGFEYGINIYIDGKLCIIGTLISLGDKQMLTCVTTTPHITVTEEDCISINLFMLNAIAQEKGATVC